MEFIRKRKISLHHSSHWDQQFNLWPPLLIFFFFVLALGTVGYVLIEDWPWFDAFYMTVITMATVGFGEIHPMSMGGRILTIVLIFLGASVFVFATTAAAQAIFRRQFFDFFTERKMNQQISELTGHVVVCGFGRMSRAMINEFIENKTPVVLIDSNIEQIESARELGILSVHGDASDEESLLKANIKSAQCLVTLIPKDSENLYVVMAARELVPDLYIVCRSEDESADKRLLRAGANRIISPYRVGGQKIARAVLKPFVFELMELATQSKEGALQIEEIRIPRTSPICGKSIKEIDIRKKSNIIILSLVKSNGEVVFNPSGEEFFEPASTLVTLGSKEDLTLFEGMIFGT